MYQSLAKHPRLASRVAHLTAVAVFPGDKNMIVTHNDDGEHGAGRFLMKTLKILKQDTKQL